MVLGHKWTEKVVPINNELPKSVEQGNAPLYLIIMLKEGPPLQICILLLIPL